MRATLTELTAELELPVLLKAIVERASGLLNAAGGELGLYDDTRREVKIVVSFGFKQDYVDTRHKLGEGAMGIVAQTGEPLILEDYSTWEGHAEQYARDKIHAIMAVPLQLGKRLIGVITVVAAEEARKFSDPDVYLLNLFAQQAAIAIENARLFDEAQREILERDRAEKELRRYQELLEERVAARTLELQDSEARYRTLFAGIPVGLYRTTPAGEIVDANPGLVQMLGYPDRDALLTERAGSIYIDEKERMKWQAVLEHEGIVRDVEFQLKRYDGRVIWVKDSARAVKDESGQVLFYEGSMEDISERKHAELKLHEYQEHLEELVEERTSDLQASEERYRTLFDGVPVGLYRSTPGGQIVDFNFAAAQMFGFPSREAALSVDQTSEWYIDPQDQLRWRSAMEKEGVIRDFPVRMRRFDGGVIWVNDSARVVRDDDGRALYYEGSLEDITERKKFEEEIQRQKEYFEALFINNPVAVITADLNATVVSWNPMAEELFGYTPEEAIGQNLDDLVANDESIRAEAVNLTMQAIQRNFEEPVERLQFSAKRSHKDGSLVDVEVLGFPIIVEGKSVGFIVIYHDITERMQIEEQIQRQKEYFEALFVNNPVAVVTADTDGVIVSWNPMAERLFGYSQEEAVGVLLDDVVANNEAIRKEAVGYTDQVLGLDRVQVTTKRTRVDGSLVDVELLALPIIVAGEIMGFMAIYYDLTERTRFEQQILQQKEYFEALFVNNPVAVLTIDLEANIISWNPTAEKLFGYTQEEAIGKQLDDLVANNRDIRQEAINSTNQLMTVGRFQASTKRTRKDGSLVDVEVLALPVIVGGEKVGYIGIYVDISEIQKAYREAEAANQAKSVFLANMSHELRTPLNAILGFTQLISRDPNSTKEQQESLKVINRSGEHLLGLINEVLEMSKIEAGQVAFQERIFDLYDLLYGLEEMFSLRAADKGLSLDFIWAEDVPRHVFADEGKLRQILSNLLGNAVKFTRQGEVSLRVSCTTHSTEIARLHFEVEDTGPGIAAEDLAIVFEPFIQSTIGQRFKEGTGLGLSISRQFVNLMGGEISVHSELDQGSLFQFDILVGLASGQELEGEKPYHRVIGLEAGQPAYRMLIAEDQESNRRLLVKLLEDRGFEVEEAVNGQEAVEIWERWDPHLIWMDMRMPVMDGHEATLQIKATSKGQETVIIALTATAFEEEQEKVLLEECDDFLRKPFREDEIFDMLVKYLGVRFVYQELEADMQPPITKLTAQEVLTPADLQKIPPGVLSELQQATITADMTQMLNAIEQISAQNPDVAEQLANFARNYEYEKIFALIEESGSEA